MLLSGITIKKYSSVIFWSGLIILMSGCTSSWRAPVYTYQSTVQRKLPSHHDYGNTYKVRKGDTLYAIAWKTSQNFTHLAKWNHLNPPYTIYVGQRLAIKKPLNFVASIHQPKTVKRTPQKSTSSSKNKRASHYKESFVWRWPTKGKIIKDFRSGDDTRKGILIKGQLGQSIVAAEKGKVVYSGSGLIGYGNLIIIKHNNNYLSAYGHNQNILVKEGDWVSKGKKIAVMGMFEKGVAALHFEIRKNGAPLNPVSLLSKGRR